MTPEPRLEQPPGYDKYRALKLSLSDGIMTVTLSNPGKKNAVYPEMSEELTVVWE